MQTALTWLARWPLWLLHALGAGLGWLGYALSPSYRARLKAHAELAGVSDAQRRASVAEAGKMVSELPRLWLRPRHLPIQDPVRWEGEALIDRLIQQGRGLILLTPHMGSFEVSAQAYAERFGVRQPITVLYRPAHQAWLRELEATARGRDHLFTAPATLGGVRQMMRALKKGQTVGMLPDQVPPQGMGVWAPFFGQPAYTMTLAARLVQQTGAAVALLCSERLPNGRGYVVRASELSEPLPPLQGQDLVAWLQEAATVINLGMEAAIRAHASQYLWGYHRYKQPRVAHTQEEAAP